METNYVPSSLCYEKGFNEASCCRHSGYALLGIKIKRIINANINFMKSEKFNQRQKRIRDIEWQAIKSTLEKFNGNFLDIGAGTGYSMYKAESMGFNVFGIEPDLNEHGVFDPKLSLVLNKIQQGFAEQLPFPDHFFQIVYASHSLEHFQDMQKGLSEMDRVLDPEGIAIITVPTGLMALISFFSQYIFLTHRRIGKFLIKERSFKSFRNIFLPDAHGSQCITVAGEIFAFRVNAWKKIIKIIFISTKRFFPACIHILIFHNYFLIFQIIKCQAASFLFARKK